MVFLRRCLFALAISSLPLSLNAQQSSSPKHVPALDVTSMDRSVDPCVDFFAYSCGGWVKNNPIPADQASWDTYSKMQDENLGRLRNILEEASAPNSSRSAINQKIGDYYASCMDEKAIDAKGAEPLKPGVGSDREAQFEVAISPMLRHRWFTITCCFTSIPSRIFATPTR